MEPEAEPTVAYPRPSHGERPKRKLKEVLTTVVGAAVGFAFAYGALWLTGLDLSLGIDDNLMGFQIIGFAAMGAIIGATWAFRPVIAKFALYLCPPASAFAFIILVVVARGGPAWVLLGIFTLVGAPIIFLFSIIDAVQSLGTLSRRRKLAAFTGLVLNGLLTALLALAYQGGVFSPKGPG